MRVELLVRRVLRVETSQDLVEAGGRLGGVLESKRTHRAVLVVAASGELVTDLLEGLQRRVEMSVAVMEGDGSGAVPVDARDHVVGERLDPLDQRGCELLHPLLVVRFRRHRHRQRLEETHAVLGAGHVLDRRRLVGEERAP